MCRRGRSTDPGGPGGRRLRPQLAAVPRMVMPAPTASGTSATAPPPRDRRPASPSRRAPAEHTATATHQELGDHQVWHRRRKQHDDTTSRASPPPPRSATSTTTADLGSVTPLSQSICGQEARSVVTLPAGPAAPRSRARSARRRRGTRSCPGRWRPRRTGYSRGSGPRRRLSSTGWWRGAGP